MLTLISGVLGLLGSVVPDIMGFFQKKQDNEQALALLKLQSDLNINELDAKAGIEEIKALSSRDGDTSKAAGWVQSLRALVRPVITFSFFGLYVAIKVVVLISLTQSGATMLTALPVIWTVEDGSILTLVLGYYFGSRTLQKIRESNK